MVTERRARRATAAALAALAWAALLAAPAEAQAEPAAAAPSAAVQDATVPPVEAGPHLVWATLDLDGTAYEAEWQFPPDRGVAPPAWVLVQHGFARRCANLRGTAAALARAGFVTLCLNAEMAGGNAALAAALARWWAGGEARAPDGTAPPAQALVAGHSAGAVFAARLGAELANRAPQRLAGALLWDPVGGAALGQALSEVSAQGRRPVLSVAAPPLRCNAQGLAGAALHRVAQEAAAAGRSAFVGLVLTDRATHVDPEGEDTEALAVRACGDGPPRPANVQALRAVSVAWARAALLPEGAARDAAIAAGAAALGVPWQAAAAL